MSRKLTLILSISSGVLLSLPWLLPGFGWVMFFCLVPLLAVEDWQDRQKDTTSNSFFVSAFIAFLSWNILSTWWIAYVSFSGMILIVVLNSLLMASIWWIMHLIQGKSGRLTGYFSLVVFWIAIEFLQHHWDIPWPWLTLGNGFADSVEIIQWYEFTGVLGGTFWILLTNILVFLLLKNISKRSLRKTFRMAGLLLAMIFLPLAWSVHRYSNYVEKRSSLDIVVLQPNIDPYTEKFLGMSNDKQISKLISLAEPELFDSVDLIVAPETSLPEILEDSILLKSQPYVLISGLLQKYQKARFLAGAITQKKISKGETISETARLSADGRYSYDIFNSALLFDIKEVQICHKSILVNGVEKMPFQSYFSFLSKYILQLGGTSGSLAAAEVPVLFSGKENVKIGPVICFESAFGEFTSKLVKSGASLLVVLTNDGWWKESAGSWQHFGFARLRAVETRRSVVQSANTGISGFINQRGEVIKMTGINTSEAIHSKVTLNDVLTIYVRYGDYMGWICLILSALVVIYLAFNRLRIRI